ncbi:glycosyltransferase family 39 protein [Iamia majanohamensis]|uniref:Glycosyltransferase family 39 protein n=1 Tax=Iamia majanohamensis TaxID=467976 RepID=A0AAE9YH94_9ACTN|nr:glycosyltransferase family 39 protein [Iamia majanohamensis]WCO67751.1 glycosyltransferase family 39 protein [Iamia majanohamensis]
MAPAAQARAGARRTAAAVDDATLAVVVVMVALGVRLAFALSRRDAEVGGDAFYFHEQAGLIADGKGFVEPLAYAVDGVERAAADHPPLYSAYLAVWSFLGAGTPTWHLVVSALLGTAAVVLVLTAGRRLAGPRAGLLAGLAAALHPNLWLWDGMLLSETITAFTVALVLWCAVRVLEDPTLARLAATGAAIGLAALARSEMVLLLVVLVPLARRRPSGAPGGGRLAAGALGLVAAVAVVVPWAAYNQTRFTHPVPLSTGAGLVLVSSNCESTYSGTLIGYWDYQCSLDGTVRAGIGPDAEPSEADRALRDDAVAFARDHPGDLPAVAAARLGRVTGLFRPFQQAELASFREGLPSWAATAGLGSWYLLVALAAVGAWDLRRRGVPVGPLLAPLAVVLAVAVLVYGIWRFRVPGDVAVCLLAGVGADVLLRRWLEGGAGPRPTDGLAGAAQAAEAEAGTDAATAAS